MSWLLDLVGVLLGAMIALAGVASVRHAGKLADATVDFEASGPIRLPASHTGKTSRRIEAAQYRIFGTIIAIIGGLAAAICLARLFAILIQFVSE